MNRNNVILSGLIGLVGAVFTTAFCLFAVRQGWVSILVSNQFYAWGLFLFLAIFSVAEIPLMIYGIRRIAQSPDPRATSVALITNMFYVLFGAVYALPYILLTGRFGSGMVLAAFSIARFISAVVFLPYEKLRP